jgi:hypothetical protein
VVEHTAQQERVWRCHVLLLLAAGFAIYVAICVAAHDRPKLALRQLAQPIQWGAIGGYHPRGYKIAKINPSLHMRLQGLLDRQVPQKSYGGDGEPLEDVIIYGRTSRIFIPPELQAEMRKAFRPLLEDFCSCDLAESATVGGGGLRVYWRGASLASHLDTPHRFVVSATLNIRQADNHTRWPLTLRKFGGGEHAINHHPGEAVLYEGSRMLHSRPVALEDEFYVAAFVGFVPRDYPRGRGLLTRLFLRLAQTFS